MQSKKPLVTVTWRQAFEDPAYVSMRRPKYDPQKKHKKKTGLELRKNVVQIESEDTVKPISYDLMQQGLGLAAVVGAAVSLKAASNKHKKPKISWSSYLLNYKNRYMAQLRVCNRCERCRMRPLRQQKKEEVNAKVISKQNKRTKRAHLAQGRSCVLAYCFTINDMIFFHNINQCHQVARDNNLCVSTDRCVYVFITTEESRD